MIDRQYVRLRPSRITGFLLDAGVVCFALGVGAALDIPWLGSAFWFGVCLERWVLRSGERR